MIRGIPTEIPGVTKQWQKALPGEVERTRWNYLIILVEAGGVEPPSGNIPLRLLHT